MKKVEVFVARFSAVCFLAFLGASYEARAESCVGTFNYSKV
jgi:hypothetical protein